MKRLAVGSVLFALVAACSGTKKPDDSAPIAEPPPSSQATPGDAGATVPSPPPNGEEPSDVPQGSVHHAERARVAQVPSDAGAPRLPVRDAGAPGGVPGRDAGVPARDAGAPGDAGAARDAGAPGGAPGDAGSPRPAPGPGSAPPPGSPAPPTSPR